MRARIAAQHVLLCHERHTHGMVNDAPRNHRLTATFLIVVRVWEETCWAWIKSASPLVASSRSGLRKTRVKAGNGGRVFSGSLVSRFGSTRHGARNNGVFSLYACSIPTHGQEASGRTGSAHTFRQGSVTAGQRRVG